jgi:hypothetical protein
VAVARRIATVEELSGLARAALGTRARLIEVTRLRGGTRKGVYRLTMDDASTAIAYLWDDAENYWPIAESRADELRHPFAAATGLEVFEAAHRLLVSLDVRVPRRYLIDRSRECYPAPSSWRMSRARISRPCWRAIRSRRSRCWLGWLTRSG